jgi:hypothetical protein
MTILDRMLRPVTMPIEHIIEQKLDARVFHTVGLIPITQFGEQDVFIVGYPKSGHTWLQNLVAGVNFGIDMQFVSDTLVQDLVPDVHFKKYYRRYCTPMFFKSHHLPRPEYRRVIYLLRDGRDVMVSYYHHTMALRGKPVDFLKLLQDVDPLFGKWHEHVQAWLSNPYRAKVLIIKYEDLKYQPADELKRLCEFVGIERDRAFTERVVEGSSIGNMRLKEARYGWADPKWPKDKPFVRRGEIGSYKDEMPQKVLDAFLVEAQETLVKHGYVI